MTKSVSARNKVGSPSKHSVTVASTLPPDHAPLDRELLKRLYAYMLRCRLVHDRAAGVARASRLQLRPADAREAIEVGCTIDLLPEDVALCPANSIAGPLLLGASVGAVLQHFSQTSKENGDPVPPVVGGFPVLNSTGFPTNVVSLPPSADALAVAAGIAYGYRHLAKSNIIFALDAGTVPARAVEAFTLISRDKLPVIAVIENLGKGSHPARLLDSARQHAIPCITVDANDVVAVYRVAREAIHRARTNRGGTVIDCYPLPVRGRKVPDPLVAMQEYMARFGLWSDTWKAELETQYIQEIQSATSA
jgi:pyruvate dehydrogenase E1 component alpha subunit